MVAILSKNFIYFKRNDSDLYSIYKFRQVSILIHETFNAFLFVQQRHCGALPLVPHKTAP